MKVDLPAIHPSLLMHKIGLHTLIYDQFDRSTLEIGKPENNGYVGDKRTVLDALVKSVQDDNFRNIYKGFYDQWQEYLKPDEKILILKAKTGSRFLSGLSYGAAMHVGFSLHHTYGVPYITGSTVKGACRAIAELDASKMGDDESKKELQLINQIYRDGDKKNNGRVVFLDAFPEPLAKKTSLMMELDVITPHHTKANSDEEGYDSAPDIEEPVPVEFAVVPEGITYCFAFICPDETDREIVTRHWFEACDEGFGAKTSSGYGEFIPLDQSQRPEEKKDPKTILEEFKIKVDSNKSKLNNMLSEFVDEIDAESTPDEIKQEMADILVASYGSKNLKKRIKKGNKTGIRLERIWKS
ncbi:type III-B CRISPR module RAMP protein Cmr6 [Maridesulfovibrio sp.]|uniref:type III-B CRISPR module RAMP protein Cmr6 n=1 Tax=Maridesulfovibrio sp. TaxID=2795000 RepID=UPI0029F51B48|nr:type III-B CRISPR module RAMP protein Cmr6 [Maridesulfovibrio sp.]